MDVSVYIPCYNAEKFLDRVIPALMAQTHPITEVLIIDDGSIDATVAVARRYENTTKYPIRVIQHDGNKGLGAARNTGVRESKTELIASLDADCAPRPDWLEKLMRHLSDESIAGAGGKLIESVILGVADKWRAVHMSQQWGPSVIINPEFLYGHSNVFRVSAIKKTGYYDEQFRTNAEDYHMSVALLKAGYRLIYEPQAEVLHLKTDTIRSVLTAYWRYGYWSVKPGLKRALYRSVMHVRTGMKLFASDLVKNHGSVTMVSLISPVFFAYCEMKMWFKKAWNP